MESKCWNQTDILFTRCFEAARPIEFNINWSNGVGGYDLAVVGDDAVVVGAGKMACSVTPSGKKLIFFGTRIGNVVIWEDRLWNNKMIYGAHANRALSEIMFIKSAITNYIDMVNITGEPAVCIRNIGERIDQIYKLCKSEQGL